MKLSRKCLVGALVLASLACGGGGSGGGSNSNPAQPPAPAPPPPPPPCSGEKTQVTALVEPAASSCGKDNLFSVQVFNGRCSAITLDSITTNLVGPKNGCGDLGSFDVALGLSLEPKETRVIDYATVSWCCNGCSGKFTCAWKAEIELETSVGEFKATSDFFSKTFKASCPSCPTQPEGSGSGPQIGCQETVGVNVH